ncbi:dihydrofolate reductase family protein [Nonomuraea sp. NPDC050663]|uniref:dihydrofolate reductase family protein n=1 Tax=Nonomuraea sp. NPDC050663 TaxID=3364370 RepID=UPI0037AC6A33
MSKIVSLVYISLDGVVEDPSWTGPYWNDEHAAYASERLFSSDALLFGRVTYQGFAEVWPHMEETEGEFAVRMNTLPKYVVSATLDKAEWNNSTIITGDLAGEVASLKERHDGDILTYAGDLTTSLIKLGLVDELKLWLHPVVVGAGKRMFPDGVDTSAWQLAGTTAFSSGAIVLDYRPAAV